MELSFRVDGAEPHTAIIAWLLITTGLCAPLIYVGWYLHTDGITRDAERELIALIAVNPTHAADQAAARGEVVFLQLHHPEGQYPSGVNVGSVGRDHELRTVRLQPGAALTAQQERLNRAVIHYARTYNQRMLAHLRSASSPHVADGAQRLAVQ